MVEQEEPIIFKLVFREGKVDYSLSTSLFFNLKKEELSRACEILQGISLAALTQYVNLAASTAQNTQTNQSNPSPKR